MPITKCRINRKNVFLWITHAVALTLLIACETHQPLKPLHNKKVMILGNSITQNGTYVDFMEYYLRKAYPNDNLDIISIGLSSETVNCQSESSHPWPRPCIHSRLDDALREVKPDLVLSCYGMNDGLFSNWEDSLFETYIEGTEGLISKVRDTGAEIILLTPTTFDSIPALNRISYDGEEHGYRKPYYNYNTNLKRFGDWLLTLEDVQVIDWHRYLDEIQVRNQQINPDTSFVPDAVHPNFAGHFLMAKKVLMDLYPELDLPDPYPAIVELRQDALFLTIRERRKYRSDGWRNYIGYTREKVVKTNNILEVKQRVAEYDQKIKLLLGQ